MEKIKADQNVVRYTVETDTLSKGTITAVYGEKIQVGDFVRNVQFIDEYGNNVGRNGVVLKILKTKFYDHGIYKECELE